MFIQVYICIFTPLCIHIDVDVHALIRYIIYLHQFSIADVDYINRS